jgi:ubiquitin C-terminal hydrolase
VIQVLNSTKDFRDNLSQIESSDRKITILKKIFNLLRSSTTSLNISFAFPELRPSHFISGQQNDCGEYLEWILGAIEEPSVVRKSFGGTSKSILKCVECQEESETTGDFVELALCLPDDIKTRPSCSIQDMLNSNFQSEKLTREDGIDCTKCGKRNVGYRCTSLKIPPQNLIIGLKLTQFDKVAMKASKILASNIVYSEEISIQVGVKNANYELYAFIVHRGMNLTSGHYFAHANHPENGWLVFNDDAVSATTISKLHR